MRARPRGLRVAIGSSIAAFLAASARAQDAEPLAPIGDLAAPSVERSWIPAVSLFGVGLVANRKASVSSDARGTFSGSTRAVIGGFGGSAELSGPMLPALPGRLRVFAHADASYLPDPEEPVVNEGDPGPLQILSQSVTGSRFVGGVQGRGSATRVHTRPLVVSAGLGLSLEFEAWERSMRLKPSLEWQWQEDVVHALFGEVESENPADSELCDNSFGCRTLFLSATGRQAFHALGPGLELEADAGRIGSCVFSVYASSQAYRVLGDRGLELTATGNWVRELDGLPSARAPTTLTSTYQHGPWSYRFGVGMRILFRPE